MRVRGNERRVIFRDDRDRQHFLELLAELPERFGTRLHRWVLLVDEPFKANLLILRTFSVSFSLRCAGNSTIMGFTVKKQMPIS